MKSRLNLLGLFFGICSIVLLARLFFWQVLRKEELSTQARLQHQSGEKVPAQRGNILASDGSWLTANSKAWLVFVSKPDLKESLRNIANKLAPFLIEEPEDEELLLKEAQRLEALLLKKEAVWLPLKHKVNSEIKKNIEALSISGIGFEPEETRVYPEASSAAHILGFVGKDEAGDDKGYFGLEGYYDLSLTGRQGFIEREADAQGVPLLFADSKEINPKGGVDLVSHIDKTVQLIIEKELKRGIGKYAASAGTVIVLNPENGALLAMASFPGYDPLRYFEYGDEYFRNPAISDAFEPGSIFKPIIMAAALDTGVVEPDTRCEICSGPVKVDKYIIETWNQKYDPDATMSEVIIHSNNVGMVFVGEKLGANNLFDYLKRFGIGELTGIDLQGEVSPELRKKGTWNIVDLATAGFGQGIAVTPIQMVKAIAIIANEGREIKPQVIDKITKDGWVEDIKPEIGKQVISQKTTQEVKEMMVLAVKEGESKWIQASGFKVAGKTGTAQIPVSGHYDEEKTIGSFVGFAPADNPRFVMLVSLREPQTSPWASETAAPLWFSIARQLFPYLGIQPEN